jgi:hypothetical protein
MECPAIAHIRIGQNMESLVMEKGHIFHQVVCFRLFVKAQHAKEDASSF